MLSELVPQPTDLVIHFDGLCEPNPGGIATYGWIIRDIEGNLIEQAGAVVRRGPGATNNLAEYSALGKALLYLIDSHWVGNLTMYGDSKLVVEQVNGNWQCRKDHIRRLRDRVREHLDVVCSKHKWSISWIPREENDAADALSKRAYELDTGRKCPERRKSK